MSRLTQVSDPTGTYQFVYDNLGRLEQTITNYSFLPDKSFTVSYGYDAASNRISLTDSENDITTYAYDALNQLTSLTAPGRKTFKWTYDAIGLRTMLSRPNSVATSYTYDSLSRLISISHDKRKSILDGAVYTNDAAGNRTCHTPLPSGTSMDYTYDDLYQLVEATQNASPVESYSYDEVGNRLSSIDVSPYVYNSSDELTSTPDTAYSYDNNGNLLSQDNAGGTTSYTWDPENRLTSITLPGSGETVSFQYDPFGRRIYKSSPSGTTIFVYDGYSVIEEVSADGSLIARYTQSLGIDEPLAMLRGSTMSYYQTDGLGSVTSLSDSKGNLVSTYEYDTFGNLLQSFPLHRP
jgi:YD repeat-containing protein